MPCPISAAFALCLLALALAPKLTRATSEVIILGSGVAEVAADSKEVVSSWLANGDTVTNSRESCKLRRVGSSVALAAGFLEANEFSVALRRTLKDQDALQLAIVGMRDGVPGVSVIAFRVKADDEGNISISSRRQRCPGDCPGRTAAFFLGVHEDIEKAIADDPSLAAAPTLSAAAYLNNLEY